MAYLKNLAARNIPQIHVNPARKHRSRIECSYDSGEEVFDPNGTPQTLGRMIARGGEGSIYELATIPDVLVKIYHDFAMQKALERGMPDKIELMRGMVEITENKSFAWPRISVFDSNRKWIGYAMRRAKGHMLQTVCQPQLVRERLSYWKRRDLVATCISLLDGFKSMHENNVLMGDVNPANLMLSPKDKKVFFIDCDSYQVAKGGKIHICPVGIPMYQPPEILSSGYFSRICRTVENELFSVAVILFKILTVGAHPYSHINGADPISNIKSGRCPLGKGSNFSMPKGPWYVIWSHLPSKVKSEFITTFRDGHRNPRRRTSIARWRDVMEVYAREIEKGWHSDEIFPKQKKLSEYRGVQNDNQYNGERK